MNTSTIRPDRLADDGGSLNSPGPMRQPRLGVDIGRVIIDGSHHPDGGDTAFFTGDTRRLLRTPAMADVFEVLPRLVASFGGRVWLVSKCGERVEQRTRIWLAHHRFAERTGIPVDNLRFCRRRPDKATHCAELGITHFVDDRPDVHAALAGVVEYRFLFGPQPSPQLDPAPDPPGAPANAPVGLTPSGLIATLTWAEVERAIRSTAAMRPPVVERPASAAQYERR